MCSYAHNTHAHTHTHHTHTHPHTHMHTHAHTHTHMHTRYVHTPFTGLMHSVIYFNSTLSDSDIATLAAVNPGLHIQPECRCPPSHPVTLEYDCEDSSGASRVPRVNSDAHDVSYINDGSSLSWWQSPNGEALVNITISLGGLRTALVVGMHFQSLLPRAMILHYSTDGVTFTPRQFYAADCSVFNLTNNGLLRTSTDINCVVSYSLPLRNQFVEFRVLDVGNRPGVQDYFLSSELQDFAQASHVRLELLSWNTQDLAEQYFAINEVIVHGQACVCNGHASMCSDAACVCAHNTTGTQCEQCLPLFNNEPWVPGTVTSANPCEMCQCNGHAVSCVFNATLQTGSCVDCADNTLGTQCESCQGFFYRPSGVPQDSPNACQPCSCIAAGVADGGDCRRGDNADGSGSGQCSCKTLVTGRSCNQCLEGYFNLSASIPDGCELCRCNTTGTVASSSVCDMVTGQCPCKPNVVGLDCSSCASGHYGIERDGGCLPCDEQCVECAGPGPTNCRVRTRSLSLSLLSLTHTHTYTHKHCVHPCIVLGVAHCGGVITPHAQAQSRVKQSVCPSIIGFFVHHLFVCPSSVQ